jgi:hypothetical protein
MASAALMSALTVLPACRDAPADLSQGAVLTGGAPELAAAFVAVYGAAPPVEQATEPGCTPRTRRPAALVKVGQGWALVVTSQSINAASVCTGPTSIHYVRRSGGGLRLVRSWPDISPGSEAGYPAEWRLRWDLFSNPAIENAGEEMQHGFLCRSVDVFELAPAGPVLRLSLDETYSDNGHYTDSETNPHDPDFMAVIEPGEKDRTLRLRYLWETRGLDYIMLRRSGATYASAEGEPTIPEC